MTKAYDQLLAKFRSISLLEQASGVLNWDQETMMPAGGADMRAAQMGEMAKVIHARQTDAEIGSLLSDVDPSSLNDADKAHLGEMQLSYDQATKIPASLAAEMAELTSKSQHIWAKARADQDFKAFIPTLEAVVAKTREWAKCLKTDEASDYEVMLGSYERGMTCEKLDGFFDELQTVSRELREVQAAKTQAPALEGHFPKDAQMALATDIAERFGYPFDNGRIDISTHPFSTGNFDDTRITTRVDEADPLNCLYSTIHEVGHSVYEYGISRDLMNKPAGVFASMGVHESQSRYFENQIGRGRAFMDVLAPKFNAAFGTNHSEDALYEIINRVETGYIRTEADELHYNLHVILRYNLERDLINGQLEVAALEDEWNKRFKADFGLDVPHAALGVLQDVHWPVGLFGYFPTYALGNIYAANLGEKLRADIPDLDAQVSAGENANWRGWLRENIHQHGRLYGGAGLVERATGRAPQVKPLTDYLREKFA